MEATAKVRTLDKVIRPGTIPTYHLRRDVFCKIRFDGHRLSITGVIGPRVSGNAWGGCGQIDMEFEHRNPEDNDTRYGSSLTSPSDFRFAKSWNPRVWLDFLDVWKKWHLNDMRSSEDGSAWEFEPVPGEVLDFLESLPDSDKTPQWV